MMCSGVPSLNIVVIIKFERIRNIIMAVGKNVPFVLFFANLFANEKSVQFRKTLVFLKALHQ